MIKINNELKYLCQLLLEFKMNIDNIISI